MYAKFLRRPLRRLVLVLYLLPGALVRLFGLRVIALTSPGRIGHLCVEPDCFCKEGELGLRPRFRGLFLIPAAEVANRVVLDLWKRRLTIVTSTLLCRVLRPLTAIGFASYSVEPYAVAINRTARCGSIYAKWSGRSPLLRQEELDSLEGRRQLAMLGIPVGAWFVCVHSREGSYSPFDEHLHSYRNSSIANYIPAMRAIVEAGGWCIRVGEASSQPIPPMTGIVDYAHSHLKSDWMDVFLCANCAFFLGNSSGLCFLSTVFGVPSALANLVPMSSALPFASGDIGIPKIVHCARTGRQLTFKEVLESPMGNFRFSEQYRERQVRPEENSAEDIRELAVEMLERAAGRNDYTEEDDALQTRFRRLFSEGHYSFGSTGRVGRSFLRKYAHLID